MKKGFTMIELIFVIVILGILAAVAIPRLAATRDDAEISKAATNVSTLVNEINGYYQAQAQLPAAIEKITNIPVEGTGASVSLKVKNKGCITFAVSNATTATPNKNIAAGDPILTLSNATGNNEVACKGTRDAVKKLMESSPIKLGGSNVKFEE
nr:prepilin-type N-terminal cleavage/methylation domain-containing protein [uncultured Campylobacter sp.]